ncbi:CHAT domain-containing protein [Moorena sp. SIO4G3]|uniref:CHAT domain-containing protein n=1 Tax=Moorena sp. SIO4G3 TaxID=2607821 RepID=UPI00142A4446|nr:CHAT domain-containing protein [Moorena sp. SIO4G3]NEO78954.1 CHAT domain-containing protein [Moorena sp. SIO4G3]
MAIIHQNSQQQGLSLKGWLVIRCHLPLALWLLITNLPAIAYQSNSPTSSPGAVVQYSSNPSALLQQGKEHYQAGQFFEAATLWQQAATAYASNGASFNQAQALNYLSLAQQELGQWQQAQVAIAESITILQSVEKLDSKGILLLAQALNTQGSLQLAQGQTKTALETWEQAEDTYARANDETGKIISQINQAQAWQFLGQYRRARNLLEQLVTDLENQPDTLLKADGLRSLGIALQVAGDLLQSKKLLEQSWAISKQFNSPEDTSPTLLSIGNVARDLQRYDVAWTYYQEAAKLAPDGITKVQAQLNQLSLLVTVKKWDKALSLIPTIESNLSKLPPSRLAIYARVNLAESMMKLKNSEKEAIQLSYTSKIAPKIAPKIAKKITKKIANVLAIAIQEARQLQDARAEAYSLNQLAKLYQQNQQWEDAQSLTEKALQIAQTINAGDIIALAATQLGQILKQQGDIPGAIAAYETAYNNLQSLRSDLVAINPDVQFKFQESIEPIYRDLVSLLLTPSQAGLKKGAVSQSNLKKAREVIEALQLAELDNYFRDACLDTEPIVIDEIDVEAAVIYPIILSDRIEVILSLPNQPLSHYTTLLPEDKVKARLRQVYSSMSPGYPNNERLRLSEQIYDWLIRPAEAELANSNIKTLVFVPDGFLRNLPMAAIYDGKQYLIENYSIAISPGLQLFPQRLQRVELNVLVAGLTEARQGYTGLPGVAGEVQEITDKVTTDVLLNQEFTRTTFQTAIDSTPFPIVHLATHGQFSSNPKETFLLTWNDRIGIKDFDLLFQKRRLGILEPIELLVMSACQTAAGDNRATLGLAGFALRSGAHSTLGSLWSVSDESTTNLMKEFYQGLIQTKPSMTKAEALQQAQLKLRQDPLYKHPYFWASFVLVGNWL